MPENNFTSDRKRSRPVTKKKKSEFFKKNMIVTSLIIVIIIILSLLAIFFVISEDNNDTSDDNQNDGSDVFDTNPIAIMDTTRGTIKIELYMDKVPITAGNFLDHAESGYYDGVIFHRVIPNFMIQGGDPLGTGTGGHAAKYHEGYGNPDNPNTWVIPDEFNQELSNTRGTISMANSGPNTGGSQFFINIVDNSYLDYNKEPTSSKHAVFGIVTEGMDVVDSISQVDRDTDTNKPYVNVLINSITIEQ